MIFLSKHLWPVGFGVLVVAGCSGPTTELRQSCEARQAWMTSDAGTCAKCKSAAVLPECGCEDLKAFSGACASEAQAKASEKSCTQAIDDCVKACAGDCECAEGCYANAPDCRAAATEVDACVTDVCAPYCDDAK